MRAIVFFILSFALGVNAWAARPAHLSQACLDFIENVLPKGFKYDWVKVPLDVERPEAGSLDIFYWGNWKSSSPILYINGGPGFSSGDVYAGKIRNFFEKVRAQHGGELPYEYLFFDQRGTGCSGEAPQAISEYVNFGVLQIVRDTEAVRKQALGEHAKPILWGQSFGSVVAWHVYRQFGSNYKAVVTTGQVLPPELAPKSWFDRLENQQISLQQYFARYPGDEAKVRRLFVQVKDVCVASTYGELCGDVLVHALVPLHLSYQTGPISWESLHAFLEEYVHELEPLSATGVEKFKAMIADMTQDEGLVLNTAINYMNVFGQNLFDETEAGRQFIRDRPQYSWLMTEQFFQEGLAARPAAKEFTRQIRELPLNLMSVEMCQRALMANPSTPILVNVSDPDPLTPARQFGEFKAAVFAGIMGPIAPGVKFEVISVQGHGLDVNPDFVDNIIKSINKRP